MELKIRNGDYIADGIGGERRADGAEALLERALFRLSVRRGSFPFLPELGSELYRLGHEKPSARGCRGEAVRRRGAGGGNGADGGGCGADGARGRGHGPARAADGGRRERRAGDDGERSVRDGEGMDGDL